jgi:hypothetical protein
MGKAKEGREEKDQGDGGKEERMVKGGEREETEERRAKERRSRVRGFIDGEKCWLCQL